MEDKKDNHERHTANPQHTTIGGAEHFAPANRQVRPTMRLLAGLKILPRNDASLRSPCVTYFNVMCCKSEYAGFLRSLIILGGGFYKYFAPTAPRAAFTHVVVNKSFTSK